VTIAAAFYDWLVFLHVLAAMVWVGGSTMLGAMVMRALRGRDPRAIAAFTADLRALGPRVLAPATVAVVGLGVWLVLDSAAWGFGQVWVQIGLGLAVVALAVGGTHQARTALRAEQAVARGDHDDARRQLVRWAWGYGVIVLLLVAAAWDMVTKPGL
jgi:uncharacterized membrane protein